MINDIWIPIACIGLIFAFVGAVYIYIGEAETKRHVNSIIEKWEREKNKKKLWYHTLAAKLA